MQKNNSIALQKNSLRITSIILFIVAGLFLLGSLLPLASITLPPASEENTVEFKVTISNIIVTPHFQVATEEHNASFVIAEPSVVVNANALNNLVVGSTISIRIWDTGVERMTSSSDKILLVAMNVNGTDIITFDSFNENDRNVNIRAIITFSSIGGGFLIMAIIFLVLHRRKQKETPPPTTLAT